MVLHMCLRAIVILTLYICRTLGCSQRNTTCNDITTLGGFKFLYECPAGSEVSAYINDIVAAYAVLQTKFYSISSDIISMDNSSIVTEQCRDLKIHCIFYNGPYAAETCVNFKITEMVNDPNVSTPWGSIIGVLVGVILLLCIIGFHFCCYISWKKDLEKLHCRATFSGFLRHLLSFCSHKKGISPTCRREGDGSRSSNTFCSRAAPDKRHNKEDNVQNITTDNFETAHNNFSLIDIPPITDPRGSGENDTDENEQDNTLRTVSVHSTDATANGKIPQNLSLNCNLGNKRIQPTKKNLRHDPGGGLNHNKGTNIVRNMEMDNGCTLGHGGPEGQLLLFDQRAPAQGFDMTGEAIALVNKHGFDPDQVNMCSTAPDTDVESTPKMRKTQL